MACGLCTVMYSYGYLFGSVATNYTHVILRKVFFFIFNTWMNILHTQLMYHYAFLSIFSRWCDNNSKFHYIQEGILLYLYLIDEYMTLLPWVLLCICVYIYLVIWQQIIPKLYLGRYSFLSLVQSWIYYTHS